MNTKILIKEFEMLKNELLINGISLSLVSDCEKLVLKIRKAFVESIQTENEYKEFAEAVVSSNDISVDVDVNGVIKINIPMISPFKKLKTFRSKPTFISENDYYDYELFGVIEKANTIKKPLEYALLKCKSEGRFRNFDYTYATIRYCNYYCSNVKADIDNYEYKQLTDSVMSVLNDGDDNSVSVLLTSSYGEQMHTEITVYPSEFSLCFKKAK